MSSTPLTNIIYYGFFTTDLKVTVPSSTFTQPTNFSVQTVNEKGDSGVLTNVYLQKIILENNNLNSVFQRIDDSDTLPATINFNAIKASPYNTNDTVNYDNLILLNTSNFYYINDTKNYKYPETGFLYNFNTSEYSVSEYINKFNYIPTPSNAVYSTSIDDYLGVISGTIQINMGKGNISANYLGNNEIIYNPFLANKYNNFTYTGNQDANGWFVYSTNY